MGHVAQFRPVCETILAVSWPRMPALLQFRAALRKRSTRGTRQGDNVSFVIYTYPPHSPHFPEPFDKALLESYRYNLIIYEHLQL